MSQRDSGKFAKLSVTTPISALGSKSSIGIADTAVMFVHVIPRNLLG
jgi:hypothetical protein